MAQIVGSEPAEKDPGITMKAGAFDLAGRCPSRGTICGDVACLPRPPQRTGDRCATPEKSACARDGAGPVEDMRRISVEMIPPREDRPRSEEHTSELQSLMRIPYAAFCLQKKTNNTQHKLPYLTNNHKITPLNNNTQQTA